ncbi:MAG TPA: gamma-glutamyltransferase [Geminicoccaceae bacterium]|nr:gamma-glutamyltransferase [Geminicoccaceae bacterium]
MRDFERPGRSAAYAEHGMAATSHPAATLAALDALRAGGNAVDAAVAAMAVHCVVEPGMTGIGGDCFVLLGRPDGEVVALNGSGRAPAAATPGLLAERGVTSLEDSVHAITVPGAIDAWARLLAAHGSKGLDELLQPAIRYAEDGFLVTPRVAYDWAEARERVARSEAGRAHYLPAGTAPVAGQRVRLPALAKTLRAIAARGRDAFYTGEIAERMAGFLQSQGGLHTVEDFATAAGAFVNPIKTSYRGLEIFECPPNGQGVMALQMLNILEGFELGALDPNGPERFHLEAEATRLARRDRDACLADPAHADVPVAQLLDKRYAAQLRALIDPDRALPALPPPLEVAHADTVYLTVVDRERNVVSFINSLFEAFGSGLACPETGVVFHNRGKSFSLDQRHPNAIAPGKRPMHTIIPALARKDGLPVLGFGVMGGHYQPVGQVHVLTNLLDFGQDPQAAIDAPRAFAYGEELQVERGVSTATAAALAKLGHRVVPSPKPLGGGQMIMVDHARGVLIGGSDPRKDGMALGY